MNTQNKKMGKNVLNKKEYDKEYHLKNEEKRKAQKKEYYQKNKEKLKEKSLIYYREHKDKMLEYNKNWYLNNPGKSVEYQKTYNKKNPVKVKEYKKRCIKEYEKNRKNIDPLFKLYKDIKNNINSSFKKRSFTKKSRTYEILGCSFEEFKTHLESKFESWMTWENHGKYNGELNYGWDVDHILPISLAKTEEELLKLNHYTNLQPLCGYTNRYVKKDKINKDVK